MFAIPLIWLHETIYTLSHCMCQQVSLICPIAHTSIRIRHYPSLPTVYSDHRIKDSHTLCCPTKYRSDLSSPKHRRLLRVENSQASLDTYFRSVWKAIEHAVTIRAQAQCGSRLLALPYFVQATESASLNCGLIDLSQVLLSPDLARRHFIDVPKHRDSRAYRSGLQGCSAKISPGTQRAPVPSHHNGHASSSR